MAPGRLSRKIGIVAAGRAAQVASAYGLYALAARFWEQEACGLFAAVWALVNALVPLFLLGLPAAVLFFFPRRAPRPLVWQAGACLLLAALVLSAALYLWGAALLALLGAAEEARARAYIRPFIPHAFALVAGGFVEPALVAADRPHWPALLGLAFALATLGVVALGGMQGLELEQVLWGLSLVGVVRLLAGAALVRRALGGGPGGGGGRGLGELLAYARPIALNDAVGALSRSVDRFVVLACFGSGAYALYHFGAVEVPISLLLAAVVSVLVPEISRLYAAGQAEAIARLWRQAVARLALVALPLFCFFFAFAGDFIAWYLPPQYGKSVWVFRIFLLALPLRCAIYNPLLVGMGKANWALWGSIGDLLVNLGLSLWLVQVLRALYPQMAFAGPALATVAATYGQVLFLVAAIGWHLRWSWRRALPWGGLLRTGLSALAAAAAARAAAAGVEEGLASLLLGGPVFALVLGGLLAASAGERAALRQLAAALWPRGGRRRD